MNYYYYSCGEQKRGTASQREQGQGSHV